MKLLQSIAAAFGWRKGGTNPNDTPEQVMAEFRRNWKVEDVEIDVTTKDSVEVETTRGQIYTRRNANTPTK